MAAPLHSHDVVRQDSRSPNWARLKSNSMCSPRCEIGVQIPFLVLRHRSILSVDSRRLLYEICANTVVAAFMGRYNGGNVPFCGCPWPRGLGFMLLIWEEMKRGICKKNYFQHASLLSYSVSSANAIIISNNCSHCTVEINTELGGSEPHRELGVGTPRYIYPYTYTVSLR